MAECSDPAKGGLGPGKKCDFCGPEGRCCKLGAADGDCGGRVGGDGEYVCSGYKEMSAARIPKDEKECQYLGEGVEVYYCQKNFFPLHCLGSECKTDETWKFYDDNTRWARKYKGDGAPPNTFFQLPELLMSKYLERKKNGPQNYYYEFVNTNTGGKSSTLMAGRDGNGGGLL